MLKMGMPLNIEEATKNAGVIKAAVLDRMLKDKVITLSQHKTYNKDWQFVVFKKSWYKQIWRTLNGKKNNEYFYKLVNFSEGT